MCLYQAEAHVVNAGFKPRIMKDIRAYLSVLFVLLAVTLSSCELVGDIFEAGMWTAVIIIVLIVLLVGWLFRKLRR